MTDLNFIFCRSPIKPAASETQPKKITINRKITVEPPKQEEKDKEQKTTDDEATSASEEHNSGNKVIKIGAISAEERAKIRAQKFGVAIPDDLKKAVRAERFGAAENKGTAKATSQVLHFYIKLSFEVNLFS